MNPNEAQKSQDTIAQDTELATAILNTESLIQEYGDVFSSKMVDDRNLEWYFEKPEDQESADVNHVHKRLLATRREIPNENNLYPWYKSGDLYELSSDQELSELVFTTDPNDELFTIIRAAVDNIKNGFGDTRSVSKQFNQPIVLPDGKKAELTLLNYGLIGQSIGATLEKRHHLIFNK